ncbi:FecR domain-containing protein [Pseudomonas japonica]|uniref:FecR family protein n=1 Tax=Pseudomonas japonica TaxID=256466 RepID=A0A239JEL0_9PSED|nr:FecR domain-containing protein [Pseudomonas japonica]SNT04476.1 FecR family protein [Pseudomonas japonica]
MTPPPLAPAEREALRSAAQWYARLSSGLDCDAERQRWQHWHNADPLHRRAWEQVEAVRHMVEGVPGNIAASALHGSRESRRRVLRQLLVLAGVGVVGGSGWHSEWGRELLASHHTGVGERRPLVLADGSQVLLDSRSALDVRFDPDLRLLRLISGRVLVQTAADTLGRPFLVETPQGQVRALGTRFSVQTEAQFCEVAVLEKAVEVRPADSARVLRLEAGQQVRFDRVRLGDPWRSDASVASWRNGSLIAIQRPLDDLLDELSRYRRGWLRCDPSIAGLRISGAFPLDDTDRALAALESGFGLRIVRRTDYWVSVLPAQA